MGVRSTLGAAGTVLTVVLLGLSATSTSAAAAQPIAEPPSTPHAPVIDAFPAAPRVEQIDASRLNYTSGRPGDQRITQIVIHDTETSYAQAIAIFRNPRSHVSAHYLIRGIDGHVARLVDEVDTAWHAGNWSYNVGSIGIEHELERIANPRFTEAQYRASAALVCDIAARHRIPLDRQHVIGHVEVPGQIKPHFDPGPTWDWPHYMWLLSQCARPAPESLSASWVTQSYPPALAFGTLATVTVVMRNTGTAAWRRGTPSEVRLGVVGDDHSLSFLDAAWLSANRPAVQREEIVAPGATVTFRFTIRAARRGEFALRVCPVVDGVAWLPDHGIYVPITVIPINVR